MSDIASDDRDESPFVRTGNETPLVIPVIEESLDVSKTVVTTGVVRVQKTVREREVLVSEPLASETVQVERVPMDVVVDSAPEVRMEGDVTIFPVVEEELVTTKRLRLVEEVRVTKLRFTNVHHQNVSLRAENIAIEHQAPLSSTKAGEERLK